MAKLQKVKITYPNTPQFKDAIDCLNKQLSTKKGMKQLSSYSQFDYPDYCGLPKRIANKLLSHEVDYIQDELNNFLRSNYNTAGD